MNGKYFLTGASGCIGGWIAKNLVERGDEVYALVRSGNLEKLRLIMSEADIAKINIIKGDLAATELIDRTIAENGLKKVIHLGAMQLPLCQANPSLGARTNVEGTINIFEACKKNKTDMLVFASTTAVYGYASEYENDTIHHGAARIPHTHYGIYKVANESTGRLYYDDFGLSSIGLIPYVAYGPLRDLGMTSTPTTAMKAAVKGEAYEISYGGQFAFQYNDDLAKAFIMAADCNYKGADTFDIGGDSVDIVEVVEAIETAYPASKGKITFVDKPLPFPFKIDNSEFIKNIGQPVFTPLLDGVKESIEIFNRHKELI